MCSLDENDIITLGTGANRVDAGHGNDKIYGRADDGRLLGGPGDDSLTGEESGDAFAGVTGEADMSATDGFHTLWGGFHTDIQVHGTDADELYGDDAHDDLRGGSGADVEYGGPGADALTGGDASDVGEGDDGVEALAGDAGTNDTCDGRPGALGFVIGGSAADRCETTVGFP